MFNCALCYNKWTQWEGCVCDRSKAAITNIYDVDWRLVLFYNRMYVIAHSLFFGKELPLLVVSVILKCLWRQEVEEDRVWWNWTEELMGEDDETMPLWLFYVAARKQRPWQNCLYFQTVRRAYDENAPVIPRDADERKKLFGRALLAAKQGK